MKFISIFLLGCIVFACAVAEDRVSVVLQIVGEFENQGPVQIWVRTNQEHNVRNEPVKFVFAYQHYKEVCQDCENFQSYLGLPTSDLHAHFLLMSKTYTSQMKEEGHHQQFRLKDFGLVDAVPLGRLSAPMKKDVVLTKVRMGDPRLDLLTDGQKDALLDVLFERMTMRP
ncbi:MAG: hypothetical protein KDD46_00190 [Bdellovibrionales bacterium]|nr:hypothetical protein [Bdellovibrionales bacterium]